MPRIVLKHKSPEFADTGKKQEKAFTRCDMPGCSGPAEHRAPKNRGLNEYYRFCLEHVTEYNKAWDFFSGMAGHEVEAQMTSSFYGDRPTWKYGVEGDAEEILYRKTWQTYHFTEKEPPRTDNGNTRSNNFQAQANTPEFEALALMGLEPPVTLDTIKARYKDLAKKHHPDLNQGCRKSEELLKRINMAYTILKLAYAQFEKLPDRD